MRIRWPRAAPGHRARPRQERGLTQARFIGSFPAADFRLTPARPEVAFAGRSNVGKSTLLNAVVGRRALARTSRTPGKTRALNVYNLADQAYFVDLPGYGYARLPRSERTALSRLLVAYFATRQPAGVIWLLDIRRDPSPEDVGLGELLAERRAPVIVAFTKVDQVGRGERRARAERVREALGLELPGERLVFTSGKTREGVMDLRKAIERLVGARIWG